MTKICLFGGTFNPPHLAHKRLALKAAEALSAERVIIMPAYTPPHKRAASLADGEDRFNMCSLLFTEPVFTVSRLELLRGGKSYSVDTVEWLKNEYPGSKIYMLIGSDMLLSFHRWYKFEKILQSVTLCAASRDDGDDAARLRAYAKGTLGLDPDRGEIVILPLEPLELSSTEIRRRLENGQDAGSLLSGDVLEYIKKKGLYQ